MRKSRNKILVFADKNGAKILGTLTGCHLTAHEIQNISSEMLDPDCHNDFSPLKCLRDLNLTQAFRSGLRQSSHEMLDQKILYRRFCRNAKFIRLRALIELF